MNPFPSQLTQERVTGVVNRCQLRGVLDKNAEVFAATKTVEEKHTEADSVMLLSCVGLPTLSWQYESSL